MKKNHFRCFILALVMAFLLVGCDSTKHTDDIQGEPVSDTNSYLIDITNCFNMKLPINYDIVFSQDEKLYVLIGNLLDKEKSFYTYDFAVINTATGEETIIQSFDDIQYYYSKPVLYDGCLILPVLKQDNTSCLLSIDTSSNQHSELYCWNNPSLICSIKISSSFILLHKIDILDADTTNYTVALLSDSGNEISRIDTSYANGNGTCISAACIGDESIYCLSRIYKSNTCSIVVEKYTLDGELDETLTCDLDQFEGFGDELGLISNDTVTSMAANENFLIFDTINGRIAVYEIGNGTMLRVNIPQNLYDHYPCHYHFVGRTESNSCFINPYSLTDTLYVFDNTFSTYNIYQFPIQTSGSRDAILSKSGNIIESIRNTEKETQDIYIYSIESK